MPATLPLLGRTPITYSSAINQEENFIHISRYVQLCDEFYGQLSIQHDSMVAATRHHLNLSSEQVVRIGPQATWLRGSFNVCIPVEVAAPTSTSAGAVAARMQKLLLRCPLPFKFAEIQYPGAIDEKMSCEVGAYSWMQKHCPDVRIPNLYGFGFSGLQQNAKFSHVSCRPFHVRVVHWLRQIIYRFLGRSLSDYVPHATGPRVGLSTPYLLLEYIDPDQGQMLSKTWNQRRHESPELRQRLFRGLSRIILSLARVPQPRIGSFQFHNDGSLSLTNRPLTTPLVILENDGSPRTIDRDETFADADTFASRMLSFHDERFRTFPNAIYDSEDCHLNMAARVVLRALLHRFITPDRAGPFLLQLTDLHASNILVDSEWNITCLIDLEWICALPATMLNVPYWLTGRGLEELSGDALVEFNEMRREFIAAFEQEEKCQAALTITHNHGVRLSKVMHYTWDKGIFWFWQCLMSINALSIIVAGQFCANASLYNSERARALSHFWCDDVGTMVERKVQQYQEYSEQLKALYEQKDQPQ